MQPFRQNNANGLFCLVSLREIFSEELMANGTIVDAFALGFPHGETTAPVVTARGEFDIAAHMVAVARRYGIPVVEEPEICSLLSQVEVGCSIPESLFRAAAALLVELGVLGEKGRESVIK